jgi:hypothetical protein
VAQPYLCFVFLLFGYFQINQRVNLWILFLTEDPFLLTVGSEKKAKAGYTALSCAVGKVAAMSEA